MSAYLTEEEIPIYCTQVDGVTMADVIIASDLIDGYLGRSFTPQEFTDRVKVSARRRGKLKHAPVIELKRAIHKTRTMFGDTDMEVPVEGFDLDPENDGYFTYIGGRGYFSACYHNIPHRSSNVYEVTYIAGYDPYPSRLKTACAMLAQNVRQAQGFAGAKKLTSLDFSVEMTNDSFFTSDIKNLLKGLDHAGLL